MSKQSHEGKLKAELNGGTHKPCDQMNGHKANERITKAANERTDKITFERRNKPDNRTSEMPAKQTENDQRIEQTPVNPTQNEWLKYTSPFSKRRKSGASLVQDIEKHFRVGFKTKPDQFILFPVFYCKRSFLAILRNFKDILRFLQGEMASTSLAK